MFVRETITPPAPAPDFRLAQQHRIQPGRNLKKMPYGLAIVMVISETLRLRGAPNEIRSENWKVPARIHAKIPAARIYFAAIARGEHQRLFEDSPRAQFLSRALGLLLAERHPLAHLNWRRAVIESDENNFHAALQALLKIAVAVRKIQIDDRKLSTTITKLKMHNLKRAPRARCCPRQAEVKRVTTPIPQRDDVLGIVKGILARQSID